MFNSSRDVGIRLIAVGTWVYVSSRDVGIRLIAAGAEGEHSLA